MLVLSRKPNEEIIIGENIRVVVVEVKGDKVRLGVDAPRDVPVHRKEIFDDIKAKGAQSQNPDVFRMYTEPYAGGSAGLPDVPPDVA